MSLFRRQLFLFFRGIGPQGSLSPNNSFNPASVTRVPLSPSRRNDRIAATAFKPASVSPVSPTSDRIIIYMLLNGGSQGPSLLYYGAARGAANATVRVPLDRSVTSVYPRPRNARRFSLDNPPRSFTLVLHNPRVVNDCKVANSAIPASVTCVAERSKFSKKLRSVMVLMPASVTSVPTRSRVRSD